MFIACMKAVLASSTAIGDADDKLTSAKNFSLKNLSDLSYKSNLSLSGLKSSFQFKGTQVLAGKTTRGSIMEVNSALRFDKGNITYVFPYKMKVKAPKFKTPSPVN
jgi:hypothetical protein